MNDPCAASGDRMWQVLDGDAEEGAAEQLVAHLRICDTCRVSFDRAVRAERLLLIAAVSSPADPGRLPSRPRLRRRQRSPVTSRTGARPWLLAAAALLMLGSASGIVAWLRPPASWAVLVDGGVHRASGPLVPGAALAVGDDLLADHVSTVCLRDGTRIALAAGTRLGLREGLALRRGGHSGVLLRLDQGEVTISARPQDPAAPLAVQTPLADVVVVGTSFRVSHDDTGSDLAVASGRVRFDSDGAEERIVGPGGTAHAEAPRPPELFAGFDDSGREHLRLAGGEVHGWRPVGKTSAIELVNERKHEAPTVVGLDNRSVVRFNGANQSLAATLEDVDLRSGITVFALVRTRPGGGAEQRVVSLSEDGDERLALVRLCGKAGANDDVAVLVDGQPCATLMTVPDRAWLVGFTWSPDGGVTLKRQGGISADGRTRKPALLHAPVLRISSSIDRECLAGDLHALEIYRGALDPATFAQRFAALAAAHGTSAPPIPGPTSPATDRLMP